MWAIGVYDFRLTSEQFWELTPPQFAALARRHEARVKQDDSRPALICHTVANMFRSGKGDPIPLTAFMPQYGKEPARPKKMAAGELRKRLELAFPRGD